MLAILLVEMEWTKENRTHQGALKRKAYYHPVAIEADVNLMGEGIFFKRCKYYQQRDEIVSAIEASDRLERSLNAKGQGKAFLAADERQQRCAIKRNAAINRDKGAFYTMDKLEIPCIIICKEEDSYRIKWFDDGRGMPKRRGGNEDFGRKGARLSAQPDLVNETAFVLREGQSGLLKYNYRYTSFHGQWYKCYYVYVVNEKTISSDIFIRAYDYEYDQMADLF